MKTYIVQLEDHDDVISARDKISWSKAQRVLLVWPRKGKILERRVDLLLLQRHSQQNGAQLGIVTRSGDVCANARDLGIPTFSSTNQAKQTNWRRSRKAPKPSWVDRTRTDPQNFRQLRDLVHPKPAEKGWLRLVMFPLGVLAFLSLVLFFVPGAEVELTPAKVQQQLTIPVWASPAISVANPSGGIPAYILTAVVEGRDQAASTGQMRFPDQRATGQVLMTNLTDQVINVPEGSLVITSTDPVIRFELIQSVTLPTGVENQKKGLLRAVLPGVSGNVTAGKITALEGPLGLRVSVENPDPTIGGSDRTSPAPTDLDYQRLREKLLGDLQKNALAEIQGRVTSGQQLLGSTIQLRTVVEENRAPAENQPGDHLQLSIRAAFEAWVIQDSDLQAVAQAALDANRQPGLDPIAGSLQFEFTGEPNLEKTAASEPGGVDNETANWEMRMTRDLAAAWSETDLVRSLLGLQVPEAQTMLQDRLALAEKPRIRIYPEFWTRFPYLPFRIQLVSR